MFLPTNITLKFGDSGDFVSELQRRLSVVQCFSESMINGFYDGNTTNGVSRFQAMVGIPSDGIAGPETLRRLNGAISGDFGSASTSTNAEAEEEERKRREAEALHQQQLRAEQERIAEQERQHLAMQQQMVYLQQPILAPAAVQPPFPPVPEPQPVMQAPPPPPPVQAPPPPPVAPAPTGPSAAEMLAQMLTHVHAPQQQHSAAQAAPPPPVPPAAPATIETAPAQAPAEQPRGLVARAMQYANETIGKLASYFESKLPRHVIDEVKQIGHAMASSGVREVPIPVSPEQQRERSVEQQRGVQQGRQLG